MEKEIPICVDLDYTLIASDILIEQIVSLLNFRPYNIFALPIWILFGKRYLKNKLFEQSPLDYKTLPYRNEVIEFLKQQKNLGRKIILVTASLDEVGKEINRHINIFDEVYGTNSVVLKGKQKAKFLVEKFGQNLFDYIGDSNYDLSVWKEARLAYVVTNSKRLQNKVSRLPNFAGNLLSESYSKTHIVLRQIRLVQWVKNLLVFVAMVMAHIFDSITFSRSVLAFLSFSFLASSVYGINDILDLQSDRTHPSKRKRPLASGEINAYELLIYNLILFGLSLAVGFYLGWSYILILLGYLFLNYLYSIELKKIFLVDLFCLTFFYSLRVFAGGVATDIPVSKWLLGFSFFFFLSLASLKRYSELLGFEISIGIERDFGIANRPYSSKDANFIELFGISSAFSSVLVFILYINSSVVFLYYSKPEILWFVAFLLLYWLIYLWNKAKKNQNKDFDPIIAAFFDKISLFSMFAMLILFILASIL